VEGHCGELAEAIVLNLSFSIIGMGFLSAYEIQLMTKIIKVAVKYNTLFTP
jgi:hypothetical protein